MQTITLFSDYPSHITLSLLPCFLKLQNVTVKKWCYYAIYPTIKLYIAGMCSSWTLHYKKPSFDYVYTTFAHL